MGVWRGAIGSESGCEAPVVLRKCYQSTGQAVISLLYWSIGKAPWPPTDPLPQRHAACVPGRVPPPRGARRRGASRRRSRRRRPRGARRAGRGRPPARSARGPGTPSIAAPRHCNRSLFVTPHPGERSALQPTPLRAGSGAGAADEGGRVGGGQRPGLRARLSRLRRRLGRATERTRSQSRPPLSAAPARSARPHAARAAHAARAGRRCEGGGGFLRGPERDGAEDLRGGEGAAVGGE
jgi:hypothetical protein